VLNGDAWRERTTFEHYAETGEVSCNGYVLLHDPGRVAQAIADAEQRERSATVARIRAWAAQVPAELSHYADDLRLLADEIEHGEHVCGAGRAKEPSSG
jgi:hypothetical protein